MFIFDYLDIQYDAGKQGLFIDLLNSETMVKFFLWGIMEQATAFVLIYILPMLLAIKFRTDN